MNTLLKTAIVVAFAMLGFARVSVAQHDKMKDVMEDVFEEMENSNFTLRFFDAITGKPVQDAYVLVEKVGEFKTDSAGRVRFATQPDGKLRTIFKKDKYITSMFFVDVVAETIFMNRFSVSPIMDISQFRVVLDWDEQPADLDAHFVKKGSYHLSYRNTRVLADGTGQLDRDDLDGYGAETITVNRLDSDAEYTFFIDNYTLQTNPSATPLSRSKAMVRVYGNNRLLKTFEVSPAHSGRIWNVFKVVNGQVVEI